MTSLRYAHGIWTEGYTLARTPRGARTNSGGGTMAETSGKKLTAIREPYTKARLVAAIAEDTGLSRKDISAVFDSLAHLMHRHLKKRAAGVFTLPGLAKFKVSTRKATKERQGRNPFTGEEITVAAKPTRRIVRIRALKAVQEMAKTP